MTEVDININDYYFNVKYVIVVKLSPWFCDWIESTFYVYLLFILHQFVNSEGMKILFKHCYLFVSQWPVAKND